MNPALPDKIRKGWVNPALPEILGQNSGMSGEIK
jgi:hypothetical protein